MGNLVAIVGRPNVGKSTLFNRLTKTRQAIVNEEAGTTRDRQYGKTEWLGREFSVVDTGGWVVNSDDIFEEEIRKQVLMAVDEADVILFVVDVMNGVTDLDEQVAAILRRAKKPVLLVANKTDNHELQYNAPEFYSLGLGDPYCISAVTGSGTGDMMDLIVSKFKKESDEILDEDIPRFAVVGRPNAGKSSIVNAFIGEDRNIVTEIAGTTRDSIYTRYNKFGFDFYLVDTAGIRKKNKVNEDLEYYSVIRSIRAIEGSDVCILMLDATRGIESQDLNIFSLIQKNQKGLVVVINKWDLVEDKSVKVQKTFEEAVVYRAFTSNMIIKKLKRTANIKVQTVGEALEKMAADGIEEVIVQPTHVINGIENDQMKADALSFRDRFSSIVFGNPLLTTEEDNQAIVRVVADEFRDMDPDTALVLMGHGTEHYANTVYAALDYRFKDTGHKNIFLGTVEAYPALDSLLRAADSFHPKKIVLAPFMIVAGDHAQNDLAGADPDSWMNRLSSEGYEVTPVLKGLGEYPQVRQILVEHVRQAMNASV